MFGVFVMLPLHDMPWAASKCWELRTGGPADTESGYTAAHECEPKPKNKQHCELKPNSITLPLTVVCPLPLTIRRRSPQRRVHNSNPNISPTYRPSCRTTL